MMYCTSANNLWYVPLNDLQQDSLSYISMRNKTNNEIKNGDEKNKVFGHS